MAIRDNDIAARDGRQPAILHAFAVFMTSAFITGIAGALFDGHLSQLRQRRRLSVSCSASRRSPFIVGGLGSSLGAILGAIFIVFCRRRPHSGRLRRRARKILSTGVHEVKSIAYGVVIDARVAFEPGPVGVWRDAKRLWTDPALRRCALNEGEERS